MMLSNGRTVGQKTERTCSSNYIESVCIVETKKQNIGIPIFEIEGENRADDDYVDDVDDLDLGMKDR